VLLALLAAATSCTSGLGRGSEALGGSPTPTLASGSGGAGPAPTPAPDGRPAVVVRTPLAGDQLVSPVGVSGRAYLTEGEVTITLLDAAGDPLASTSTDVSCGAGCRGTFSADVAFFVQERVDGTIAVFEISPEDGPAVNVVSIPVTFVPGS
jgi:hypothetical protein